MEVLVESQALPEGALQLLCAGAGDLLDHLGPQDVVAFTGSSDTAVRIRSHSAVIRHSVRVNVEADSLNAAVLGPDVAAGDETYELFLKDVLRDMTQKAGQKCTAIRRVLVPAESAERVCADLVERLGAVVVGNPANERVRMGPVASAQQRDDVKSGIAALARDGRLVFGSDEVAAVDAPPGKGFFVSPALVELEVGAEAPAVHGREVFGPVATVIPFTGGAEEAAALVRRGEGGLVSSVYSEDAAFTSDYVLGIAPFHGRVYLGSVKVAEQAPGPGTVLPQLVHGGPGRAGGGEELGGVRGLHHYMQRVALEGPRPLIERIAGTKSA
jgi:oxepin-CoA hydrolase/3-oxo-5,6-dehydrosuberyl-CoA semialdehyde dehydrogenase